MLYFILYSFYVRSCAHLFVQASPRKSIDKELKLQFSCNNNIANLNYVMRRGEMEEPSSGEIARIGYEQVALDATKLFSEKLYLCQR